MGMTASSTLLRVSPISSTLLLLFLLTSSSASDSTISYADHCVTVVPESPTVGDAYNTSATSFHLTKGIISGSESLLGGEGSGRDRFQSFYFRRRSFFSTQTPGVYQIIATLSLHLVDGYRIFRSRHVLKHSSSQFHQVRPRITRPLFQRGIVIFDLYGYWSEASGKLCMVGTGHGQMVKGKPVPLSAVFKLDYPKTANISSSLVKGSLESLDDVGSSNHFDQISILAYALGDYEYTQITDAQKSCARINVAESLGLGSSLCYYVKSLSRVPFELDYKKDCSSSSCGPFAQSSGFTPNIISFNQIKCSGDGKLNMYVGFSNLSNFYFGSLLIPGKALVSEGIWDREKHQICLVACRIKSSPTSLVDSTVDACKIRICLWFPAVWSIESRSTVVGRIWSKSNEKDSDYFDLVSFSSTDSTDNYIGSPPGLKYNYTRIEAVRKSCVNESPRNVSKWRYPDGKSSSDFRFYASVSNSKGRTTWGYFKPVTIGDKIYGNLFGENGVSFPLVKEDSQSLLNISYDIHINGSLVMNGKEKISAEGIYNTQTGFLCLVACQSMKSLSEKQQISKGENIDCGIVISIHFAPLIAKQGDTITGTIRSTRDKKDPLYFEQLDIIVSVAYTEQAVQAVWRMDIEIIMVMVSLTLSCIFIVLQLFYVKKYPEVLPSVSITMLVILTLGHMIPLVLNFQALFRTSGSQNVLMWSGGWLEANEVIVRLITMVAFLLQFRFLQLTWTARSINERVRDLWTAEKNVVKMCLPLYFVGGLIAWFVHMIKNRAQVRRPTFVDRPHVSLWVSLISYAGLILDGFLLPQVAFNIFSSSKDKALSPYFYVGNTIVRSLPHAYDAYRSQHYVPRFNSSYLYASPQEGFYSFVWDIIIPCAGILLSVLIYLQQRFGRSCLFPYKNSIPRSYELVPVVSS